MSRSLVPVSLLGNHIEGKLQIPVDFVQISELSYLRGRGVCLIYNNITPGINPKRQGSNQGSFSQTAVPPECKLVELQ